MKRLLFACCRIPCRCGTTSKTFDSKRLLFSLLVSCLLPFTLHAQSASVQSSAKPDSSVFQSGNRTDSVPQKDMGDVMHKILHRSRQADKPHLPGKKYFSFAPGVNYDPATGFIGILSGSVVWQTKNPKNPNLSVLYPSFSYTQKNQIIASLFSSVWTAYNYTLQGNAWFMKFPEFTYGLGSRTPESKRNQLDYNFLRFYESLLRKVAPNMYAGVGYKLDYHSHISEEGTKDGTVSDFRRYGLHRRSVSSGPSMDFIFDTRGNAINPPRGSFINFIYSPKLHALGSDSNWQQLQLDVRKYVPLSAHRHSILAFWGWSILSFGGSPPYLDLPSVGWDNLQRSGRGYEQSRYRGKNMLYFESEYRFGITRNDLFGAVVFANAESFSERYSNRFQRFLPGAGAGVRVKFDKYSNSNICIDYGFGADGSRGLYINVGETF